MSRSSDPDPDADLGRSATSTAFRREARRAPRLALPPMYTFLRARLHGEKTYRWTGFVYDVSTRGMRFELDNPLAVGERVDVRAMLPGSERVIFSATGTVVRRHDDPEDLGPARMGLAFERFRRREERSALKRYIQRHRRQPALAA